MVGRRLAVAGVLAIATLTCAASVGAAPIIYATEAAYLAAIVPNFEVNVGRDGAGNQFAAANAQVNGTNILSIGNDVDFSSLNAPNAVLVTVNGGHPELGPVGPGGANWSGSLKMSFANAATAIGFGTHQLGAFSLELYSGGNLMSTTAVNAGGGFGFVGIKELLGFDALVINTPNTFWSLDGGHAAAGNPASPTRMMGQTAAVPEPASLLFFGTGLVGLAAAARRRRSQK